MKRLAASPNGIAFLDEDHVVRLVRALLRWEPGDRDYARDFFLPEQIRLERLAAMGEPLRRQHHVRVVPSGELADARALIFRRGEVASPVMDEAPALALVQRLGEASHMIDLDGARERGIHVSCLPRSTLIHVAEHAFLLMLALRRQFRAASAAFSDPRGTAGEAGSVAYNWSGLTGIGLLSGLTLGAIGMGEIGLLLARRARAFGMTVVFHDNMEFPPSEQAALGARQVALETLLTTADIVSIHVPPRPGGEPVIGRREIDLMRAGSILINTSRGSNVDESALIEALKSGHLAGAGLDVHAREPRGARDPLASFPNVVLTPHIGGGSRFGVLAEAQAIFDNLSDVFEGRPPRHGAVPSPREAAA